MGPLVKSGVKVIYFAVLLTPFFGLYQYAQSFPQLSISFAMPWYYKGGKDILLSLVYLIFLVSIFFRNRFKVSRLLSLFFFVLFAYIVYNFLFLNNILITLVGIRSLFTLPLAFIAFSFISENEVYHIAKIVVLLALLLIPLSMLQFAFGSHVHGTVLGQYAARVSGTFVQPSSLAVYLVLAVYFVGHMYQKYRKYLIPFLAVNILLTGSGIGILGLVLVFILFIAERRASLPSKTVILPALLILLPIAIVVATIYLPAMTDRSDIFLSGQGRITVITDYFSDNLSTSDIFLGKGLGYGTNSLYTIFPEIGEQFGFIPDSMYISMVAQIGVLGLGFFVFLNLYAYKYSTSPFKNVIIVFMFCGLTVNILELFPMNWVYPITLGFLLRNTRLSRRSNPLSRNVLGAL